MYSYLRRNALFFELLVLAVVVVVAYFTHFFRYEHPQAIFWDENYHIAAAQKYLNGIFFMEQHPPLGKLLVALGEVIVQPNAEWNQFIGVDHAKDIPKDFSFEGYRLVPALLGWLTVIPLWFIFRRITKSALLAALLCQLYVFDNGMIVHGRGAMLESPLLFFIVSTLAIFLVVIDSKSTNRRYSFWCFLLGFCFGCAATIKLTGLFLSLLIPFAVVALWKTRRADLWRVLGIGVAGFVFVFVTVWAIHFSLGKKVNPELSENGYYRSTAAGKEIIDNGRTGNITAMPKLFWDWVEYVPHFSDGVPKLDLCKADETGSPFFLWPVGGRTISYRWETSDYKHYRYLYLVPNPVTWWFGLFAVFAATSILLVRLFLPVAVPLKQPMLLVMFWVLYVAYMLAMSRIDRVMYMYHYFPALMVSYILSGVVLMEVRQIGKFWLNHFRRVVFLYGLLVATFLSFLFYMPFTYYQPLSHEQVKRRAIMRVWDLSCVDCPDGGVFVRQKCGNFEEEDNDDQTKDDESQAPESGAPDSAQPRANSSATAVPPEDARGIGAELGVVTSPDDAAAVDANESTSMDAGTSAH